MHTDYVNDLLESDNSNDLSKLLKLYILIYQINSDNYNKHNYHNNNNHHNSYKRKANIIKFLLLLICALIHNDSRVY